MASGDESNELDRVDPHRRKFLKAFLGAAFVAPVVASFALDGVAAAGENHDHHCLPNQLLPNQGGLLQPVSNPTTGDPLHCLPNQLLPNQHHPHKPHHRDGDRS